MASIRDGLISIGLPTGEIQIIEALSSQLKIIECLSPGSVVVSRITFSSTVNPFKIDFILLVQQIIKSLTTCCGEGCVSYDKQLFIPHRTGSPYRQVMTSFPDKVPKRNSMK